jgi:eukaryotic-like serine/threonine-protein kinase
VTEAPEACGEYRLRERTGAGGVGEIFRAEARDATPVAIEGLLPECARDPVFVGMFLDEARLARRLRHPNIAEVYGHSHADGSRGLAAQSSSPTTSAPRM